MQLTPMPKICVSIKLLDDTKNRILLLGLHIDTLFFSSTATENIVVVIVARAQL